MVQNRGQFLIAVDDRPMMALLVKEDFFEKGLRVA